MAEEVKVEEKVEQPDNSMYIEEIKNLKNTTVSKTEYERIKDENRMLLKSLVEGSGAEAPAEPKKHTQQDIDRLRNELYRDGAYNSNLDYVSKTLELREALMENGEADPFVPSGSKYVPDDDDYAAADKLAKVLGECIEFANGDSELFTNELQRRTIDVGGIVSSNKNKRR